MDRGELASPEEPWTTGSGSSPSTTTTTPTAGPKGSTPSLLGTHRRPSAEIDEAIAAGRNARASMRRTTDADRDRDCSLDMAVSYGLDSDDEGEVRDDYYSVRGLK